MDYTERKRIVAELLERSGDAVVYADFSERENSIFLNDLKTMGESNVFLDGKGEDVLFCVTRIIARITDTISESNSAEEKKAVFHSLMGIIEKLYHELLSEQENGSAMEITGLERGVD